MVERIAQEAELINLLSHWTDVIQRAAYHIRGVSQIAIPCRFVETLFQQHTVDMGTKLSHPVFLENPEQLFGWCRAHLLQGVVAMFVHILFPGLLGLLLVGTTTRRRADAATALYDHIPHHALRKGRRHQVLHAGGSCTLSENGDVVGVAAKLRDVLAHPFQGCHLVVGAVVARRAVGRLCRQLWVGKKTEDTQAVVDGNENHAPRSPCVTVHGHLMAIAVEIGSAMHPESHRQFALRSADGLRWRPYVQI